MHVTGATSEQMESLDDPRLVRQAQRGDAAAFEALVRPYYAGLLRLILALCQNPDDAEDCLQEVLVRAYRCMDTFRGDASIHTWLHRIALNTTRNWIRSTIRAARQQSAWQDAETEPDDAASPEQALLDAESRRMTRTALLKLPSHYREPLLLRYYEDMSYQETAAVLQIPVGTVRSRIAQAKVLLQRQLAAVGLDPIPLSRCVR